MGEPTVSGLPASIEAAWGVRSRSAKGPKAGLSLERVVAAAVDVASDDGLPAVSMNRVAAELGVSPMALYRYVGAKDELLDLMGDAALGAPPDVAAPRDGWRPGVTRWAWAEIEALRRHPWALRIPINGPPVTPNSIRWLEQGLRCLAGTPLGEGEKLSVMMLLSGYVHGQVLLATDLAASAVEPVVSYAATLSAVLDADDFPAITALIDAEVFGPLEPPATDEPGPTEAEDREAMIVEEFAFGLERILDGVETLMRSRARTT